MVKHVKPVLSIKSFSLGFQGGFPERRIPWVQNGHGEGILRIQHAQTRNSGIPEPWPFSGPPTS